MNVAIEIIDKINARSGKIMWWWDMHEDRKRELIKEIEDIIVRHASAPSTPVDPQEDAHVEALYKQWTEEDKAHYEDFFSAPELPHLTEEEEEDTRDGWQQYCDWFAGKLEKPGRGCGCPECQNIPLKD